MESWRNVWRNGMAPLLSMEGLETLWRALESDDPRLIQGMTSLPPPIQCVNDWPVEAADAFDYCGWQGEGLATVAEVEAFFARLCSGIDHAMGEPAACQWFLNWYDATPRDEMRRELLVEVQRSLAGRLTENKPGAAVEGTGGPAAA